MHNKVRDQLPNTIRNKNTCIGGGKFYVRDNDDMSQKYLKISINFKNLYISSKKRIESFESFSGVLCCYQYQDFTNQ